MLHTFNYRYIISVYYRDTDRQHTRDFSILKLCKYKTVKLAASVAMNPHYLPYADLSSPHSPSPDNNNYSMAMGIGGGLHHNGHGAIMQQQGFHQLNNNSPLMNKCAGCGCEYIIFYIM